MVGALIAFAASCAGEIALTEGARLSFHVENTAAAMAEARAATPWLLGASATFLLAAAAGTVASSGRLWIGALLIAPALLGGLPLLLTSGSIIPFAGAAIGVVCCFAGLIWMVATLLGPLRPRRKKRVRRSADSSR